MHLNFLNILFSDYETIPVKVKIEKQKEENNYPKSLPGGILQRISGPNISAHFSPVLDSYIFIFLELIFILHL